MRPTARGWRRGTWLFIVIVVIVIAMITVIVDIHVRIVHDNINVVDVSVIVFVSFLLVIETPWFFDVVGNFSNDVPLVDIQPST